MFPFHATFFPTNPKMIKMFNNQQKSLNTTYTSQNTDLGDDATMDNPISPECPIDELTDESRERAEWNWDKRPTTTSVIDYRHPVRNQPKWNH